MDPLSHSSHEPVPPAGQQPPPISGAWGAHLPGRSPPNSYSDYLGGIYLAAGLRPDVLIQKVADLSYSPGGVPLEYQVIRIQSRTIEAGDPVFVIRAGIHGNEAAGSLTILNRLNDIFEYAHLRGVKLVIYPLDNPSGFEHGIRYNADYHSGSAGNNDCLRYELSNGAITADIGDGSDPLTGQQFEVKRIIWADDSSLKIDLPQETRASLNDIRTLPLGQVRAALDLHGDNYLTRPMTYQYSYGPNDCYDSIVERVGGYCEILRDCSVEENSARGSGHEPEVFDVLEDPARPLRERVDSRGFIRHLDGTYPELFSRLGAEFCITIEMSGVTPQAVSDNVQMAWIEGMIDLVAGSV